jgi:beta-1,4-mannosyl-glycoprotein beta-1,4-N-acetylglucosaminyltransferase
MYFDEDLLLDLRLNILNNYIKKFVITEATYTHNGNKKKLNFDINNFKKFKDKIDYIIVDDPPPNIKQINKYESKEIKGKKLIFNGYARDNFQREKISNGLANAAENDLVIISDLDEIPKLSNVNFNLIKNKIIIFKQLMFYYKFNLLYENFNWHGSKACKKKYFISPQWLRNIKPKKYSDFRFDLLFSKKKYSDVHFVENGGWHFTNIRDAKNLEKKLLNFAHHYDFEKSGLNIKDLSKSIENKTVMYDHSMSRKGSRWSAKTNLKNISIDLLPNYISENLSKYKDWLD